MLSFYVKFHFLRAMIHVNWISENIKSLLKSLKRLNFFANVCSELHGGGLQKSFWLHREPEIIKKFK